VLEVEDILSWHLVKTESNHFLAGGVTQHGSDLGGSVTWTLGSLSATAMELIFNWGSSYTNTLIFGDGLPGVFGDIEFLPGPCGPSPCGLYRFGGTQMFTPNSLCCTLIEFEAVVPGSVAGAGLPGLMLASLGWLGWRRRARQH
jgi:hypothetical protein